jgi:hypothetical protein
LDDHIASRELVDVVLQQERAEDHEDDALPEFASMHNDDSGMAARRVGPNISETAIDREDYSALARRSVRHPSVGLADPLPVLASPQVA